MAKAVKPSAPKRPARSLAQFVADQRRAGCPVCALPPDVLADVKTASRRKIPKSVVLEWLASEHGRTISAQDMAAHVNARHDQ